MGWYVQRMQKSDRAQAVIAVFCQIVYDDKTYGEKTRVFAPLRILSRRVVPLKWSGGPHLVTRKRTRSRKARRIAASGV
jgi:hypothetical protein